MKTSQCQCGNRIFFDNTFCFKCSSQLGYLADEGYISALNPVGEQNWQSTINSKTYRKCQNTINGMSCNWMIPESDPEPFCLSCRLSEIIPNLSKPENIERWDKVEKAKRRLVYSLFWLGLPLVDKKSDPDRGLSFRLMEDEEHYSEFATNPATPKPVFTGHIDGTIILNVTEADPVLREEIRTHMQERYRTLLGHLRHESGHYYWERLVQNSVLLEEFRDIFGDEREDYSAALQRHYTQGPKPDWHLNWVSAYASSHPWEDWAECWAHYLHMIDTMETAYDFAGEKEVYNGQSAAKGQQFGKAFLASVALEQLIDEWYKLSVFVNEMTRSLGLADAYPFYLSDILIKKMSFIHKVITAS